MFRPWKNENKQVMDVYMYSTVVHLSKHVQV